MERIKRQSDKPTNRDENQPKTMRYGMKCDVREVQRVSRRGALYYNVAMLTPQTKAGAAPHLP